jgi:uncharacterized protein YneF (UPF0154 family)
MPHQTGSHDSEMTNRPDSIEAIDAAPADLGVNGRGDVLPTPVHESSSSSAASTQLDASPHPAHLAASLRNQREALPRAGRTSLDTDVARLSRASQLELFFGVLALLAWLSFFAAGIFVSTKGFRDALLGGPNLSARDALRALLVTLCCYTVTNIFFLACISSCLGCMAHRWQTNTGAWRSTNHGDAQVRTIYAAAILRGFLFYVLVISGILIVANETTITDTTQPQYVRLAGFVSVVGFIVGFNPQLLYRFLAKVNDLGHLPLNSKEK